jgi:hypothetical protein
MILLGLGVVKTGVWNYSKGGFMVLRLECTRNDTRHQAGGKICIGRSIAMQLENLVRVCVSFCLFNSKKTNLN